MIEKHTFCDLIYQLRDYWDGVVSLEKSLGTMFDNNFLTKVLDRTITTIAKGFFSTEDIDKWFVGSNSPCDDCDQSFKMNFETIEDLLYHYTCTSDFGREWGMMDDTYVITDKDGKTVETFDGDTPEELYSIIIKFLSRNDDNNHLINCSSVGRGKLKNETDIP